MELDEIVKKVNGKFQSDVRTDSSSRSNAAAHGEYTPDDVINLTQKHEKIKSFLDDFEKNPENASGESVVRHSLREFDGKQSVSDMLKAAIQKEKSGEIAIFGANKKIASKLPYSGLQLSNGGGFYAIHNINDETSPVKLEIKDNTKTLQFKRWFADSKVVDQNGEQLVVYHGTAWQGWEFEPGKEAWFSEKQDYAEEMAAQRGGNRIIEAYLAIKNPMLVKAASNKMGGV